MTQAKLKIWRDDNDYFNNNDGLIAWYDGYKKHKAQKAQIKEELLPIAWHPTRIRKWCFLIKCHAIMEYCRNIVGYQVDGETIIPLFIKKPKNIFIYGVSQYD